MRGVTGVLECSCEGGNEGFWSVHVRGVMRGFGVFM